MKNKKIAVVCNSTNSDLVNYFQCKIESLVRNGYSDQLVVLKNRKIEISDESNISLTINSSYTSSAFFDKQVFTDFLLTFYLALKLLVGRIEVVHFTTAHISNIFLSLLLKPFPIKLIFTIHDLIPHPGKKAFFIKLYNSLVINYLSDEVISFSKDAINVLPQKRKFKHFILSGFPQYIKKPKSGENTILFFGRMEQYKGFDNLLEIIKLAQQHHLDYKFILAGKGNIEHIEEFRSLNNVEIINRYISDDMIMKLFKKASFTILPYHSATQSGVTILSYSYGTPVIAYNVGALGEYIIDGKTGLLCNYRENDRIINFLKTTTKKDIIKISKNVISLFEKKYSWKACMDMYFVYYKNILNKR